MEGFCIGLEQDKVERVGIHFSPEDGGSMFVLNVGISPRFYTLPKLRTVSKSRGLLFVILLETDLNINWLRCVVTESWARLYSVFGSSRDRISARRQTEGFRCFPQANAG